MIKKCKDSDKDDRPAKEQVWCLYSKDGKKLLGRHPTEESAKKQEQAIQIIKQKAGNAIQILKQNAGKYDLVPVEDTTTVDLENTKVGQFAAFIEKAADEEMYLYEIPEGGVFDMEPKFKVGNVDVYELDGLKFILLGNYVIAEDDLEVGDVDFLRTAEVEKVASIEAEFEHDAGYGSEGWYDNNREPEMVREGADASLWDYIGESIAKDRHMSYTPIDEYVANRVYELISARELPDLEENPLIEKVIELVWSEMRQAINKAEPNILRKAKAMAGL